MSLEDDLIAVTNDISVDDLILAYDNGVFPWPIEGLKGVPWFAPSERGLLFFKDLHISKSLKKFLKRQEYFVTFNQDFEQVILNCKNAKRKSGSGTWINEKIVNSYTELFRQKKAYSVEVWTPAKDLVGGMYGVISKTYVTGESMFFKESGASKLALLSLVKRLESLGLSYIDTQMTTPLLKSFGATEVSKNKFMKLVKTSTILGDGFYGQVSKGFDDVGKKDW